MLSAVFRCLGCHEKTDATFPLRYQILTKDSYLHIVYYLEESVNAAEVYVEDGFKRISNHTVQSEAWLPKGETLTSSIVSEDGTVQIVPTTPVDVSYGVLKTQKSVVQKVKLRAHCDGDHVLRLCIRSENNVKYEDIFQSQLAQEDLYQGMNIAETSDSSLDNLPAPARAVMNVLKNGRVDEFWHFFEKAKITTPDDLAAVRKSELKEIGIPTVGDRLRVWRTIEVAQSVYVNYSFNVGETAPADLDEFLTGLDLEELIPLFQKEHITMSIIAELSDSDLIEIGIVNGKQRQTILNATAMFTSESKDETDKNSIDDNYLFNS